MSYEGQLIVDVTSLGSDHVACVRLYEGNDMSPHGGGRLAGFRLTAHGARMMAADLHTAADRAEAGTVFYANVGVMRDDVEEGSS